MIHDSGDTAQVELLYSTSKCALSCQFDTPMEKVGTVNWYSTIIALYPGHMGGGKCGLGTRLSTIIKFFCSHCKEIQVTIAPLFTGSPNHQDKSRWLCKNSGWV